MATTLSVPGANSTTVLNTFTGTANTALAQSIADTLNSLLAAGGLSVASVAGGGTAPGPTGTGANELEITSGGVVSVPAGYNYVVDGTSGAALTIAGGQSFFGGDGNINYTNAGNSADSIVAGNGADTFNLSGNYTVAAGSGADVYKLSGTGQVNLGTGVNSVSLAGGADTIFASTDASSTQILGGTGSVFFYGGNSATETLDFVVGGSAGDTIVGGANNVVIYASPTAGGASAPGALLVAGAGNETLFGAPSHTNDALWGSFAGGDNLLVAGSGQDALVAGSGNATLVGGSGNDAFYFINNQLIANSPATRTDFVYNVHAGEALALTGFDTLYGGAAGSHVAAAAVGAELAGGASSVTLKDGTTINFVGGSHGITVFSS